MNRLEEIEERKRRPGKAEGSGSALLWFAVFAGPAAWSAQIFVNYNLGESFLCAPAHTPRGSLLGLEIEAWITLVNIALLAVAVAGLVAAVTCRKRIRDEPEASVQRARWMSVAGVVTSVAFIAIVSVGFAPAFFLDGCRGWGVP